MSSVDIALLNVHSGTRGVEEFPTQAEAEEFRARVLDRYPGEGYGTHATRQGNTVLWSVGTAD